MHRKRRRPTTSLPNLFHPLPTRPTWDSLPQAVAQRVTELLAELLGGQRPPRPQPGTRKGAGHE